MDPVADAGVTVGDGVQSEMAEDGREKDRDFPAGDDFGQRHAGDDVDRRKHFNGLFSKAFYFCKVLMQRMKSLFTKDKKSDCRHHYIKQILGIFHLWNVSKK